MTFRILLIAVALILPFFVSAQKKPLSIAIEAGMDMINCEEVEADYIRASAEPYYFQSLSKSFSRKIEGNMMRGHFGVKAEMQISNKFRLASGLRYTYLQSNVKKVENPDFFYLLFREEGTTTEYLRVKEIAQRTSYLGIPIEVRYTPFSGRLFNLYFGVGADVNFKVATKNEVSFYHDAMQQHESAVSDIVGKPDAMYIGGYGKLGVAIGKENPWFTIALSVPALVSKGSSSIVSPTFGTGVSIQIIRPI